MGLKLNCPCGYVVHGETEGEVLDNAIKHVKEAHNYTDEQANDPETIEEFKSNIEKE